MCCCPSPHTQRWLYRHMPPAPIRAGHCLLQEHRRSCCSSSVSTTLGTLSPTTYLSSRGMTIGSPEHIMGMDIAPPSAKCSWLRGRLRQVRAVIVFLANKPPMDTGAHGSDVSG